ncbi:MAG: HAD family hydrolase [Ilumatobacter sp.]|nr:MAG: HAD family hydrolase [Ilumatobacter sp.]
MTPAAVLWDMDGTLVDTEPYWMASERDLVESFGHTWPEHHAHAIVGFDLLDAGRYIAEHGPVPLTPEEIVERLLDGVIARLHRGIPWRPGALELLDALRDADVPCALVTMSWRRFVDPVLAALPPDTFSAVVTGDEVVHGKPHPEPYLRAADLLGVDPHDAVAIEDSPTGVRSAVSAGCRVLGVPNVRDIDPQPGVALVGSLEGISPADLTDLGALDESGAAPAVETTPDDARRSRRGRVLLGGLGLIAVLSAGVGLALDRAVDEGPLPYVQLDVWAPYWTLGQTADEIGDRLPSMREVSPFWYRATGARTVAIDPNTPVEAAEEFERAARRSRARLVPSVVDAMPAGGMAGVLADPVTRRAHVDTLVDFVLDGDYDGLDLDYEQFAFADGRSTWAETRPNWVTFVTDLSAELREHDKTLTVSIPPVYGPGRTSTDGFWVYDHGAIAEVVDHIRIMAYDFSVGSAGPIAPLEFVQRSVDGVLSVVDDPSKLVLGIPVYGYNWPIDVRGECPADADGRVTVTPRSLDDLLERRGGEPTRNDTTGEWTFAYELDFDDGVSSCTQLRQVHYVDGGGAVERIEIARQARFGGVALWALGYEDDDAWALIDAEIRRPDEIDLLAENGIATSGG